MEEVRPLRVVEAEVEEAEGEGEEAVVLAVVEETAAEEEEDGGEERIIDEEINMRRRWLGRVLCRVEMGMLRPELYT